MKSSDALRALAELSASQWGMVTTAQAAERRVTRLELSRLAEAGHLVRLAHGVYRDAGAPAEEFEDLRAAWLSTEPDELAEKRLANVSGGIVIMGASAARLHGVGDLPADRHEFSSPIRRQSQRSEIRYRQRVLESGDVTIVTGLPVATIERTIADLVEARTDLSLVADVLRDAMMKHRLDLTRLDDLLGPLAARQGFGKGEGAALLNRLMEIAGLDFKSLAEGIAASPNLGARVAANYFDQAVERATRPISDAVSKSLQDAIDPLMEQLRTSTATSIARVVESAELDRALQDATARIAQLVDSAVIRALSKDQAAPFYLTATPSASTIALAQAARRAANDA